MKYYHDWLGCSSFLNDSGDVQQTRWRLTSNRRLNQASHF